MVTPIEPMAEGDVDLLRAFETGTLDPATFDHRAHVRVAYLYLRRRSFDETVAQLRQGLQALARAGGKPESYHETVTVAFTAMIQERIERPPHAEDFDDFVARNPDLTRRDLLEPIYRAKLSDPLARRVFVLPDAPGPPRGRLARTVLRFALAGVLGVGGLAALHGGAPRALEHLTVVRVVGAVEVVGAALLLVRRTRIAGSVLLLLSLAVAAALHIAAGQWPLPLIVYAAGVLTVMTSPDPSPEPPSPPRSAS